jgi:hypothetical protein
MLVQPHNRATPIEPMTVAMRIAAPFVVPWHEMIPSEGKPHPELSRLPGLATTEAPRAPIASGA